MADLRIISIRDLAPGMFVVQITEQNGPVKIRKQGHISSFDMVKGLTEMGVTELQIDVSQSIELEPKVLSDNEPSLAPSQTQSLLQQTQARNIDNEMSEQFNRSIFLPSIQRMPSMWDRLRGNILRYAMVSAVGILLGYSGMWAYLTQLQNGQEQISVDAQTTLPSSPEPDIAPTVETAAPTTDVVPETPKPQTSTEETNLTLITKSNDEEVAEVPVLTEVPVAEGRLLTSSTIDNETPPSPEIQARLAEALAELDDLPESDPVTQVKVTSSDDLPRIGQLPASLLTRMPSMVFAQHMYSSEADARWVRVNNRRLQEGDMIEGRVIIEAIEPQHVVLSLNGTRFRMAALTDW